MKSTIIRRGLTASVILGFGALLSACGVGGGSNVTFSTNIYQGSDYFNEPIVTVYVDGQPVNLLVDTGASGFVVNQSAVNIPPSSYYSGYTFSNTFADGSSDTGLMASATVCINPSITSSCVVMPIGVITSGNAFPTSGEAQGDIGLDSGLNIMDIGINNSNSYIIGYSYPYYLEQQTGINSYTLSFNPLSNTYYANVSLTTPIGQISFGSYSGNSNTLITYTGYFPSTIGMFPSSTSSLTGIFVFDTGSTFNLLSTYALQTEIPNFSQNQDEGACGNYIVNGGFTISYSTQSYSTSFTTEPPTSFCNSTIPFNLMLDNTADYGFVIFGLEDFGFPEMLRHTFTWVLGNKGTTNQGLVQYIGINP